MVCTPIGTKKMGGEEAYERGKEKEQPGQAKNKGKQQETK